MEKYFRNSYGTSPVAARVGHICNRMHFNALRRA